MHPSVPETEPMDLDCVRAWELLSARHDGELADASALERHLARCPACRARERTLDELGQRFAPLRASGPGAAFGPRVLERARERAPRFARPSVRARAFAALAGCAAALALALALEHVLARAPAGRSDLAHLGALLAPIASPAGDAAELAHTPERLLLAAVRDERSEGRAR